MSAWIICSAEPISKRRIQKTNQAACRRWLCVTNMVEQITPSGGQLDRSLASARRIMLPISVYRSVCWLRLAIDYHCHCEEGVARRGNLLAPSCDFIGTEIHGSGLKYLILGYFSTYPTASREIATGLKALAMTRKFGSRVQLFNCPINRNLILSQPHQ